MKTKKSETELEELIVRAFVDNLRMRVLCKTKKCLDPLIGFAYNMQCEHCFAIACRLDELTILYSLLKKKRIGEAKDELIERAREEML